MLWAKKFLHTNSLSGDFPNWDLGITSISVGFYPSSPLYFILHNFYSSQSTKPNALTKRVQRGGGGGNSDSVSRISLSKLNSTGIQNKGNKSKPDDWLLYVWVILIGTFCSSSRLKFPTQFFSHVCTSSRVSLVEMVTLWVSSIKGHRFFFINVLFYRCFLHGFYTESGPELQKKIAWKGQNFKTKLFLCYKLPLLFSTAM